MGPCHGPLVDSGGVCSMLPILYVAYSGYIRISDSGSTLRAVLSTATWEFPKIYRPPKSRTPLVKPHKKDPNL